jgi:hypothetical protein
MSAPAVAPLPSPVVTQNDRLEVLFDRLAELAGQRNALDAQLVDIVAEIDREGLWGITGCRSLSALVGWKLGLSSANARILSTLARRVEQFPRCVAGLSDGTLSLDQVGAIAARAAAGSDDHYADLAPYATVNQLITALRLEVRPKPPPADDETSVDSAHGADATPDPGAAPDADADSAPATDAAAESDADADAALDMNAEPVPGADALDADDPAMDPADSAPATPPPPPPASCPEPERRPVPEAPRSISKTTGEQSVTWRITLPHDEAAQFEAALASHLDRLVTEWKHQHPGQPPQPGPPLPAAPHLGPTPAKRPPPGTPPMPTTVDAFCAVVHAGWDADAAARPHGARTTVVVHLDLDTPLAALHLGPLLPDADRRYLTCDATGEVWFERDGRPIGAGRATRTVNRRLRRALEHRDRCCVVPGCHATRALHAHHLKHWEDGGPTELWNLVLLCPFHHRAHHRGEIMLSGTADQLTVTDSTGAVMTNASLARPPKTPAPAAPRYRGPTGERAHWWWYDPYQPPPPTPN